MSITEDRPDIEAVRSLERFIAKDGRGEHLLTFQGILRSHEALREEVQAYHDRAVTAEGTAREALTRAAALANGLAALPETPTTDDDDDLENLTYLITAKRFHERGLKGAIGEPDLAVSRPLAEFLIANGLHFRHPSPPTEEQWEYGATHTNPVDVVSIRDTLDAALEAQEYYRGFRWGAESRVYRRTKAVPAGPWEPVEAAARVGGER